MTSETRAERDAMLDQLVPRITTPRLLLRSLRGTDLDIFAEALADPIGSEFVGGVVDRRASWRMVAAGVGFWVLDGAGWWGIEMRETGELVGTVGAFFRETTPGVIELGWTVFRKHWRQGIATEAAKAASTYAFERHGVDHVIAHIDPKNLPSVRVSERLGMRYEGEVDFYTEKTGRYVLARP